MRLSFSQINTYLQCPMKYYFKYIEGIPQRVNSYLVSGKSAHRAIELALHKKRNDAKELDVDTFIHIYQDLVADEASEVDDMDELEQIEKNVVPLLKMYHRDYLPYIEPAYIEKELWSSVDGIDFMGYIDLIDVSGTVIDHKFKGKKPSQFVVDRDLQFSAYGWLLKQNEFENYNNMRMDVFVTKSRPGIWQIETHRDEGKINFFPRIVKRIGDAIDREAFYPNPTSFLCSERFCDYWEECNGEA